MRSISATATREHSWAIVLAAGEGTRLRALTTNAEGQAVPKQFCSFDGSQSLLRSTLERARRVVDTERVVVVVTEHHRTWWEPEVADLPERNVIVQPSGRGTASGVLLPLLEILERDRDAIVTALPSDHFVANEAVLQGALEKAMSAVEERTDRVVLLGMAPDGPETGYGWIVPSPGTDGCTRRVAAFVEKPEEGVAIELMDRGALWNSFLFVAGGTALIELYQRALPLLLQSFRRCLDESDGDPKALEALYVDRPSHDFSRDVLERLPERLRLLVVPPCGWTDVGTPARVTRCLLRKGRAILGAKLSTGAPPDIVESLVSAFGAAPCKAGGWSRDDFVLF